MRVAKRQNVTTFSKFQFTDDNLNLNLNQRYDDNVPCLSQVHVKIQLPTLVHLWDIAKFLTWVSIRDGVKVNRPFGGSWAEYATKCSSTITVDVCTCFQCTIRKFPPVCIFISKYIKTRANFGLRRFFENRRGCPDILIYIFGSILRISM